MDMSKTPLLVWAIASIVWVLLYASRRKGSMVCGMLLLPGMLASGAQLYFGHVAYWKLAATTGEGLGIGFAAGFTLALLGGFLLSSIPTAILHQIEAAEGLLQEAESINWKTYAEARYLLEKISQSALSLILSTGSLRDAVSLFSQGLGSAGWNRIERSRTSLERLGSRLAFSALQTSSAQESAEVAALWRSIAGDQRHYSELLNASLESLASKISFYNLQTALLVSSGAMLTSGVIGITQILLTKGK